MRHTLVWRVFFLIVIGCAGCGAPYTAQPASIPRLDVMPWSHAEAGVVVAADPYLQETRLKSVFGYDLSQHDIIPVQILVENRGAGRRLWLQPSVMFLELPNATPLARLRATVVAQMALAPAPYTPGEIATIALTNMPLLLAVNELTGGASETLSRIATKADLLPNPDGRTDYWRKELKDVILGNGESVNGFVYFPWPRTYPAFEEATLVMPIVDLEAGTRPVIRLELRGLRFRRSRVNPEEASE